MTDNAFQEKHYAKIIDYLYGNLSEEQRAIFEHTLDTDMEFKKIFKQHAELDALMSKGTKPDIQPERVTKLRENMRNTLRRKTKKGFMDTLISIWNTQIPVKAYALSMALMFMIGFGVNQIRLTPATNTQYLTNMNPMILEWFSSDKFRIIDMDLSSYDKHKGDVVFSFSLASQSTIQGNLNNPTIRYFLSKSLQEETNDDARLHLTDLFSAHSDKDEIKNTLIQSLMTDPNPGVRYNAVEALVKIADSEDVRRSLTHALSHDENPGVRVEAFLALTAQWNDKTPEILNRHGINNTNSFIRERSIKMLKSHFSQYGEIL